MFRMMLVLCLLFSGMIVQAQDEQDNNETVEVYLCSPEPRLVIGQWGRVTPGDPNNLRSVPATSADKVSEIPGDNLFLVLASPVCADNYSWWRVDYNGAIGWTVEGASDTYWLEPLADGCEPFLTPNQPARSLMDQPIHAESYGMGSGYMQNGHMH